MSLRHSLSGTPRLLAEPPMTRLTPEAASAEAAWLIRQHDGFARTWGRAWRVQESAPEGMRRGRRAESEPDPLVLAALCLQAERDGRQEWRASSVKEELLLVAPMLVAGCADVRASVQQLLKARERLPARLICDAATLLAEMAGNACEHGGTPAAVAVTWTTAGEDAGLCLAVVDHGVGIAAALARRERAGRWGRSEPISGGAGPVQALRSLFMPESAPEDGRGMGLRLSRSLVDRYRGAFHLYSSGLIVTMGADWAAIVSRCPRRLALAPGTQISVRLRIGERAAVD